MTSDPRHLGDPSSFSNPHAVRITSSDFEIDLDFDNQVMRWWAKHTVSVQREGADELILDSRDLNISSVKVDDKSTEFTFGRSSPALGSSIVIPLPGGLPIGATVAVQLTWTTSKGAVAAQWLAPEMTSGGKHPFLFSQCQAIHARSILPCQDTPGANFTYTAAVRVPKLLKALMSALSVESNEDERHSETLQHIRCMDGDKSIETRVFRFSQPMPISSYLLAIAAGELACRELSPICRVWSEPSTVDAAAYEFADTPRLLQAAESLAGTYRWGRYDLLMLPPAFPYGGMENCCLTFVTPTLLAGDRSMANVIAHEIAHSWTGNLVTNADWSSFWLNEGPTVYLERRILGYLEGEQTFQFHACTGWTTLKQCVQQLGDTHPYTCLCPDLSGGVDPDDAFSSIPYEKGFAFLAYLEVLVDGPEAFISFFKSYVERFAQQPVTSKDFKSFFIEYFSREGNQCKCLESIDWETWLYKPGMPPVINEYDQTLAQAAYDLASKWYEIDRQGVTTQGNVRGVGGPEGISGWSASQVEAFLGRLGELTAAEPLHPETTQAIAKTYPLLDESRNAEIRCAWYQLRLKAGDRRVLPNVEAFLSEQGRMKFLRPLYRALYGAETRLLGAKEAALKLFASCKHKYHPIAAKMCAVDLNLA